ncbi:MAG TPA: 50S ribosomal protein L22, partial [Bacillota bacterium]|nr:50S ribosomal protein L22 [Bacillota bacterium]
MEARCIVKHIRISPTKVGIVADLVRGKPVDEAL